MRWPACGFRVVTLANNHVMDYGPIGLKDTLEAVNAAGLRRVGAGMDWEEATFPLRLELEDGRVVHIVNWACTLAPGAAAGPGQPGVRSAAGHSELPARPALYAGTTRYSSLGGYARCTPRMNG